MFAAMGYFIGFIVIMFVLAILVTTGVKQVLIDAVNKIMTAFKIEKSAPKADTEQTMKVVQLTKGTCEFCGTVFVGTAEDPIDNELQVITFGSHKKIACTKCRNEMEAAFEKSEDSGVVAMSDSAKAFAALFGKGALTKPKK